MAAPEAVIVCTGSRRFQLNVYGQANRNVANRGGPAELFAAAWQESGFGASIQV